MGLPFSLTAMRERSTSAVDQPTGHAGYTDSLRENGLRRRYAQPSLITVRRWVSDVATSACI
jgi:hypothetical protein